MRQTAIVIATALALCACPSTPARPPASGSGSAARGSGSGSGSSTAPAAASACRPRDVALGIVGAWSDASAAYVCLRTRDPLKKGPPLCVRYAPGAPAQSLTGRTAPTRPPAAAKVTFKDHALKVCAADGACTTLTTKLPSKDTGAAVNAAGTRAAAVEFVSKNKNGTHVKLVTEVFDVKTKKLVARVATPAVGDNPCVEAKFLDDRFVALPSSNCAGPAGATQVVDIARGKRVVIEKAPGKALDTYDFDALHVGGTRYAFLGDYGATFVLYDLAIGKRTGAIDLRPYFANKGLDPPEQLKHAAYLAVSGDVILVVASPTGAVGQPGTALVIDGRTASVRSTTRLPVCR
ncbi:MAG: hypothetical protein KC503_37365 [Myxococcales bacterium]|nr:hypothetical protein [Myxococcales bacterium]